MKKTNRYLAATALVGLLAAGSAYAQAPAQPTPERAVRAEAETPRKAHRSKKAGPMRAAHEAFYQENKAQMDDIRAKKTELQGIVRAETFDKAAYLAKAAEIETLHRELQRKRAAHMANVFEAMPAPDRAQLPEGMKGRHMREAGPKSGEDRAMRRGGRNPAQETTAPGADSE